MIKHHSLRAVGLAALTALLAVVGLAASAFAALHTLERADQDLQQITDDLVHVEALRASFEETVAAERGFLLAGLNESRDRAERARAEHVRLLAELRRAARTTAARQRLDGLEAREGVHQEVMASAMALREGGAAAEQLERFFAEVVSPRRHAVVEALHAVRRERRDAVDAERREVAAAKVRATWSIAAIALLALLATIGVAGVQLRARQREQGTLERWTEFLSVASHDLKSPLATLALQVQLLERLGSEIDGEGARGLVPKMKKQVARMAALIGSVLDTSRLQLGSLRLERQEVDLALVVRDTVDRIRDQFTAGETPVTVRAPDALIGRWDRLRLEQVLSNLLSNALKYGERQPVEVLLEDAGDTARLTVRDHGVGIAPEEQRHVFERFARVKGERRPGHGLGLWITRSIVEAHGGRVALTSAPGLGSTFIVELPRGLPRAAPAPALRAWLRGAHASSPRR